MAKTIVRRIGDMHPDRALEVFIQNNGDAIVAISQNGVIIGDDDFTGNSKDRSAFVEYCVSGGRSPGVIQALHNLALEIEKENEKNPIF